MKVAIGIRPIVSPSAGIASVMPAWHGRSRASVVHAATGAAGARCRCSLGGCRWGGVPLSASSAFRSSSAHCTANSRESRFSSSLESNCRPCENSSFLKNCASTPYSSPWFRSSHRQRCDRVRGRTRIAARPVAARAPSGSIPRPRNGPLAGGVDCNLLRRYSTRKVARQNREAPRLSHIARLEPSGARDES